MRILWRNIPIPEPFVVALAIGGILQIAVPASILPPSAVWFPLGSILMTTGVAIATWCVVVARDNDLEQPTSLLTSGPYAFSRNPMYLAWVAISIGLVLLVNSLWLMIGALAAWIYLQAVTIPREEEELQSSFGAEYEAYRRRVRRWL